MLTSGTEESSGCQSVALRLVAEDVRGGRAALVPEGPTEGDLCRPVTVGPGQMGGRDPEARGLQLLCNPPLPSGVSSSWFYLSGTLPFAQVGERTFQRSFPGGIKKPHPHRHWASLTDCCFCIVAEFLGPGWLGGCSISLLSIRYL